MCGIVGYIGHRKAEDILIAGLMRLEYRGYDSSGIATLCLDSEPGHTKTHLRRSSGKLDRLKAIVNSTPCPGHVGIGHTRWATHGKPTEENAHPHHVGSITVVHNGIIENQFELREFLKSKGREFKSETDTEVISHLIDMHRESGQTFKDSVLRTVRELKGAFALAIMDEKDPSQIICVKQSCPLVIGIGDGEVFVASDFTAALPYTKEFIILEDGELATLTRNGVELFTFDDKPIAATITVLDWSTLMAEKEGHKHFMHKEIFDQPRALLDTLRGRYSFARNAFELDEVDTAKLLDIERITIVACGSSYYAGMIGKYLLEEKTRLPVDLDLASEFRYRDIVVDSKTLVLGISQSGETADTLAALRFAKDKGAHILSICNVIGSAIPRLCKPSVGTLYTRAGPEISVASTKAFIAQLMALNILALHLSGVRKILSEEAIRLLVEELAHAAGHVEHQLADEGHIRDIAKLLLHAKSTLFLGRGVAFPVALEGALKLKELSYVHAEGFAAGELKHGAIALIDDLVAVIAVVLDGPHFEKTLSNMQEVASRGGKIIAVTNHPSAELTRLCEHVITIPKTAPILNPIVATVPLQLLAYHLADLRGLDVDQPRNLAKSVTVE